MKILVIDEDDVLRHEVISTLSEEGYTVLAAETGFTGIQLAREFLPDLILCDMDLPRLDGNGVRESLRSQLSTANIPFVFMTSDHGQDRVTSSQAMQAGQDGQLTRPLRRDELLATVQARLAKRNLNMAEQYQQFTRQLVALQDTEQARFGAMLREEIYTELTNIRAIFNLARDVDLSAIRPVLDQVNAMTESVAQRTLRLAEESHPHILEDVGLVAALSWYLKGMDVETEFRLVTDIPGTRSAIALPVYRAVREVAALAETGFSVQLWDDDDNLHVHIIIHRSEGTNQASDPLVVTLAQEYIGRVGGTLDAQFEEGRIEIHLFLENVIEVPQVGPALSKEAGDPLEIKSETKIMIATSNPGINQLLSDHIRSAFNVKDVSSVAYDELTTDRQDYNFDLLIVDRIDALLNEVLAYPAIFLTAYDSHAYIHHVLDLGVRAIVLKETLLSDIGDALQAVSVGLRYVSPKAGFDMQELEGRQNHEIPPTLQIDNVLTPRELEILRLILEDKTHMEIAETLVISHRTVEKHRANIMQKLGLTSHTELILFAVRHNLIQP